MEIPFEWEIYRYNRLKNGVNFLEMISLFHRNIGVSKVEGVFKEKIFYFLLLSKFEMIETKRNLTKIVIVSKFLLSLSGDHL